MQNIFVDMSIKICIAEERRRFFNFLGNSREPVFCRWAVSVVRSGRRAAATDVKDFLKHSTLFFLS